MLRISTAAIAAALVFAPLGIHDASALATFRVMMVMPGKTRSMSSGSEFRVCNEGEAALTMMSSNSLTGATTSSVLWPGSCTRCPGSMMSFENHSNEPVALYAFGGLGGRPGRGPGHS